ncbi:hypothetical protein BU24DRAFT_419872 [Aaosphaeria arxii CBS 175.79]|uniref:Uncharacterized protein n=1 Tax=Aaosphaeria arxii CBS 175.79 TaxID=1450172 RepID=A0A6A5Y454_9PLEO|nr:uncharacterized protein BU24DRAFT_419872 [Aaosphaeria arxii CBS 175.79]KAF2020332.1 hypothetical protein BU24DRAFT_419872 [Aaosphaeria arxii CBS 175.79]
MPISPKATRETVQALAGFNDIQMDRFYVVTKEVAKKLVHEDFTITWKQMKANRKIEAIRGIELQLLEDDFPMISEKTFSEIVNWRMTRVVDTQRKYQQTIADACRSGTSRAYDPVRDT